jgi:uncharacterized protein YuzE
MKDSFSYDEYSDSLIVSNRQENEKVRENFEVGDIIFSLTGKGKIVAIEIREASSFLESCNINPNILKNLKEISLAIMPKKDTIFLVLKIKSLEGTNLISKNVPLVMPLINQ